MLPYWSEIRKNYLYAISNRHMIRYKDIETFKIIQYNKKIDNTNQNKSGRTVSIRQNIL